MVSNQLGIRANARKGRRIRGIIMKLKMFNSDISPKALEKIVNEWLENNDVEISNIHMTESNYGISMAIFYCENVEDDE